MIQTGVCGYSGVFTLRIPNTMVSAKQIFTVPSILCALIFFSNSVVAQISIVSNGNIYTVDTSLPQTEAFAFENGTILAVGTLESLKQTYADAAQIDLDGATVIPGFIDAHGHLLGLGQSLLSVDLVASTDKEDILQRLKEFAADLPKDQWLVGRGWDQNDWPVKELPSHKDLDTAFPDRPVWLERIDGHAGWANGVTLALVEKDLTGDWQLEGGEIVRDSEGNATGVFIDNAAYLIDSIVPPATPEQLEEALSRAMAKTASVGLTAMHDAGTSKQVWDLLRGLRSRNRLTVRVYAMADGASDMLDHLCHGGAIIDPEAMLTARAVKLYSDGALGSRGAALLAPYSDAENQTGLLVTPQKTLTEYAKRAADCGLQVNIHAIGDRGNRVTLDALAGTTNKSNPGRHRVEHAQVIEKSDFIRFKQLELIASVQPTHATSDMYWAEDRVGAERIQGAYAWQTFIDLDIPLALGSDFPVERPEPLPGFYAAISRQDAKAWPDGGWYPAQRLSREQALYGFTKGAAYAAFQEDQLGSIEVGKKADFVILSKDIMTVPVDQILSTEVLATYINGNAVFEKSGAEEKIE